MKKFSLSLIGGIGLWISLGFAQQNQTVFTCIGAPGSACLNGDTSLHQYSGATVYPYVSVLGYYQAADGGAGDFIKLGSAGAQCKSFSPPSGQLNGTVGKTVITSTPTFTSGLTVGELVSGNGHSGADIHIQPGTEIASIDTVNQNQITVTLPLTGSTSGSTPLDVTFTGDNGGTLIIDSQPSGVGNPGPQCYRKAHYRGEPHEWGAYGDGDALSPHDDTVYLQNWLGAYGNVNPILAPNTPPMNFGPWIATISGSYMVTLPLSCPASAVIQGQATQSTGPSPLFRIFAARVGGAPAPAFTGPAVLTLNDRCHLLGVTVDGSGIQMNGTTNGTTKIDNLPSSTYAKIQVGDTVIAPDIPGIVVDSLGAVGCSTNCVTLHSAALGSGRSETISFNGPDSVDLVTNADASRVTIDGHSLIENGYYNVFCPASTNPQFGLQLKDSQFSNSGADNINIYACPNSRVIGNVVSGGGGRGVVFGGDDVTIADNIIEQMACTGIDLTGAKKVTVSGNTLDDDAKGLCPSAATDVGGHGIEINKTDIASICGNHLTGNGEYGTPYPAQIHFGGSNNKVDLCANVYGTEMQTGDATLKPQYAYDADTGTTLTDSHLYESPSPQIFGTYSPNALAVLSQLQVPQFMPNQITGLTLLNSGTQAVELLPGTAADSSNSVLIQNTVNCPVDLSMGNGEGHLDNGTIASNTTYFFFAIAQAGGAAQNCMASTAAAPTFSHTSFGVFDASITMDVTAGDGFVYDVSTIAGIRPGDEFKKNLPYLAAGVHVDHIGTITTHTMGSTPGCPSACVLDQITVLSSDYPNLRDGMAISDGSVAYSPATCTGVAQSVIPKNDTIVDVAPSGAPMYTVQLAQPVPSGGVSNDCVTVSGGNVLFLDGSNTVGGTGSVTGVSQTLWTGVYRMVGALYSYNNGGTPNVIPFRQDNDTFYLANSVTDIKTGVTASICVFMVNASPVSCALSVPCGRTAATCGTTGPKVEAFGRIVGGTSGGLILLSSLDQAPQLPNAFPGPPGYTNNNSIGPDTSYPFRVYTDANGKVRVQGSTGSANSVYEVTDGWVFHRIQ